jgi:hypothetical protein
MKNLVPEVNSKWQDVQSNTVYTVWLIATDVDNPTHSFYVIYQIGSLSRPPLSTNLFTVYNSFTAKTGKVCRTSEFPGQWFLQWRTGIRTAPIAWAYLLDHWNQRFKRFERGN